MTDLGTKFECSECETKFYDLGREKAVCPQCGHEMKKDESFKTKVSRTKTTTKKKRKKASSEEE